MPGPPLSWGMTDWHPLNVAGRRMSMADVPVALIDGVRDVRLEERDEFLEREKERD